MKRKVVNNLLPPPYGGMTARELDAEVAKFDREMVGVPGKALSSKQKIQHRRARKMGRPVTGKGAKRIAITMERSLLGKVDLYARKKKMSRSAMIRYGMTMLLKAG